MNGNWFWWGRKDNDDFINLWKNMFDYFTYNKGLDNLLWIYGPGIGSYNTHYYPGDEYVDMVSVDVYTDISADTCNSSHVSAYNNLISTNKPFGFGEFGPCCPHDPPGTYNYTNFINGIKRCFPKTTFWQSWSGNWGLTSNKNVSELLNDSWVVNRAEISY